VAKECGTRQKHGPAITPGSIINQGETPRKGNMNAKTRIDFANVA